MSNPEQWTAKKVRSTFLDYFKERGHTFGTGFDLLQRLLADAH